MIPMFQKQAICIYDTAPVREAMFLTPSASPRHGIRLTRPDPRPPIESTLFWDPNQQVELSCTAYEFHNSLPALFSFGLLTASS